MTIAVENDRVGRDKLFFIFVLFFYRESRATCTLYCCRSCSSDFDRARKKCRLIRRSIFMTDQLRHWKPTFPSRFLAIAGIENREKCSWFSSRKKKMLLCVGTLSAFGNDGSLSRGNWRTSTMGIVSPRKVSRKQTSHICVIGESANNQTTPGSFPDRRSFDHVDFLVSGSCTHPKLSFFHLGNVNPRGTGEIVCVSRDWLSQNESAERSGHAKRSWKIGKQIGNIETACKLLISV